MQNAVHAVAMLCACTFCVIFPLALNFTLDEAMTAFCTYHVYDLSPSPNKPWQWSETRWKAGCQVELTVRPARRWLNYISIYLTTGLLAILVPSPFLPAFPWGKAFNQGGKPLCLTFTSAFPIFFPTQLTELSLFWHLHGRCCQDKLCVPSNLPAPTNLNFVWFMADRFGHGPNRHTPRLPFWCMAFWWVRPR